VDRVANLNGRTGVALGVDDGDLNRQIIIDPNTGDHIGGRLVSSATTPACRLAPSRSTAP
jgi:hypothetical protein